MALMAIASGELESALVIGAEKMTDSPSSEITASLAQEMDRDFPVNGKTNVFHHLTMVHLNNEDRFD